MKRPGVYEAPLGVFPGIGKLSSLLIRKGFDVQLGHALLALAQLMPGPLAARRASAADSKRSQVFRR